MAQTFYVDAFGGSDSNAGTSAGAAWSSLDKVSGFSFEPGDTILFARGGAWSGQLTVSSSGTDGAPITYGAYGSGADPLLTDGRYGIDANGQSDIVVRDLAIANTSGAGIHGSGVSDWVIDHVQIDRAGRAQDGSNSEWGGVQWWDGSGLTVSNSTFTDLNGEAVWVYGGSDIRILNNDMRVAYGPYTDNAQLTYVSGYEIRGNILSMAGATNSGKGNLVVEESDRGVVVNNTFEVGNFGFSVDSNNTLIEGNHFIGHTSQSWSSGILIGSGLHGGSHDVDIKNNFFDGDRTGIAMFDLLGNAGDRLNVDINGNIFRVTSKTVSISGEIRHTGDISGNTSVGANDPVDFKGGGTGPGGSSGGGSTPVPPPDPAITGTAGADTLAGTDANDTISGLGGDDTLRGQGGNDALDGGAGNDRLEGGAGDDRLLGGDGNDVLDGGAGKDFMQGGAGADTFVFNKGYGQDTLNWFEQGIDKLDLRGFGYTSLDALTKAIAITPGNDGAPNLTLNFGNGDTLFVPGISQLKATDVILGSTTVLGNASFDPNGGQF